MKRLLLTIFISAEPNAPWEVDPRVASVVNVVPQSAKPANK